MKIPNYDRKTKENSKKLNNVFDEDFRLLIAGESGCGKTNTPMHIIRKPLLYCDKIYIYSPNLHQEKNPRFQGSHGFHFRKSRVFHPGN